MERSRKRNVNALKLRLMAALVVGMEGVELGGLDLSRVKAVRSDGFDACRHREY